MNWREEFKKQFGCKCLDDNCKLINHQSTYQELESFIEALLKERTEEVIKDVGHLMYFDDDGDENFIRDVFSPELKDIKMAFGLNPKEGE